MFQRRPLLWLWGILVLGITTAYAQGFKPTPLGPPSINNGTITQPMSDGSTAAMSVNGTAKSFVLSATTAPSSGSAPSGALQITNVINTITSCPSGSIGQTAVSTGQTQIIYNLCGGSYLLYPPPGGTIGLLGTNIPMTIGPGMTVRLDGLSPTAVYPSVTSNYQWTDNITITIPAINPGACQIVPVAEPKARAGDRIILTDIGTPLNNSITTSAVYGTYTAGQISIKLCNVATLTNSTATSPTIAVMGFGSI